jgi:hypothetical protein
MFRLNQSYLVILLILTLSCTSIGQNKIADFKSKNLELRFTKHLNGCMDDPDNTVKDELVYELKGQKFDKEGYTVQTVNSGFDGVTKRSSPWETLTELFAAYQSKDAKKILDLYDPKSSQKLKTILDGPDGAAVLDAFSKVTELKILMGFEYQNGYLAVVDGKEIGVQLNYFTKINNQFFLTQLDDKSPASWNIALYWKYRPEKLVAPILQTKLDSLSIKESKTLVFELGAPGNWITIFKDVEGQPTLFFLQDGSENDRNTSSKLVEIKMKGASLITTGKYKLFAVESNYPIRSVSKKMIENATKFEFKVYK